MDANSVVPLYCSFGARGRATLSSGGPHLRVAWQQDVVQSPATSFVLRGHAAASGAPTTTECNRNAPNRAHVHRFHT